MDNSSIMRRMANQTWGDIKKQVRVCDGVTFYDCDCGSGYVVDTDIYVKMRRFNRRVYMRKNNKVICPGEQHFAIFNTRGSKEWAVFESMNKHIIPFILRKVYKIKNVTDRDVAKRIEEIAAFLGKEM